MSYGIYNLTSICRPIQIIFCFLLLQYLSKNFKTSSWLYINYIFGNSRWNTVQLIPTEKTRGNIFPGEYIWLIYYTCTFDYLFNKLIFILNRFSIYDLIIKIIYGNNISYTLLLWRLFGRYWQYMKSYNIFKYSDVVHDELTFTEFIL